MTDISRNRDPTEEQEAIRNGRGFPKWEAKGADFLTQMMGLWPPGQRGSKN